MRAPRFDYVDEKNMSLLTDLYELTMCASYFDNHLMETATFDLFIRKMPPNRSYFVYAGLEQSLFFLENIRFYDDQIDYLRGLGFKEDFLYYLIDIKFSGDVWAMPEGTIAFPNEPLMRVTAPITEAQLVETFLLNTVNLQTMLASKASRVVHAARGLPVVEFGLRRTHGTDAGLKSSRCGYMAGCSGTSNVLAGMKYGIPVFGTMAHSYVMSFDDEADSFRAFARTFPENSTFLIDTYDDLKGAVNASMVAKELETQGYRLRGVRLDSGDLLSLSRKVREILDENGLDYVEIFASGDLDEHKIKDLLEKGAKIDAFGVGTRMSTSHDRPYVDVVYKLSGQLGEGVFVPKMKLSKGKMTLPGEKQVFRQRDDEGKYSRDIIGLEGEKIYGDPLLINVMKKGELVYELPALEKIRENTLANLSELADEYKKLKEAPIYPVEFSPDLEKLKDNTMAIMQ